MNCIVISCNVLEEKFLIQCFPNESAVRYATETIKIYMITQYRNLFENTWFPTIEELSADERKLPRSVCTFLEYLLKLDNKEEYLRLDTLADFFVQEEGEEGRLRIWC